jgi:hypothetical protein
MARLDDILNAAYQAARIVNLGIGKVEPEFYLRRPGLDVVSGVRSGRDQAMDTYKFMAENMESDIVPALTIARGDLSPEASATLVGLLGQPKIFPDYAKDIHNLAAAGDPAAMRVLFENGEVPQDLREYLDAVSGLYTVDSAARIRAAGKIEPDVLGYFEPEDIPGVSSAIREASVRSLLREPDASLGRSIALFRNNNFLVDAPGRTRGVLSYTTTPEFLASAYQMHPDDFLPYRAKVGDVMTNVPALINTTWNPGWLGENEIQAFSDQARPISTRMSELLRGLE